MAKKHPNPKYPSIPEGMDHDLRTIQFVPHAIDKIYMKIDREIKNKYVYLVHAKYKYEIWIVTDDEMKYMYISLTQQFVVLPCPFEIWLHAKIATNSLHRVVH